MARFVDLSGEPGPLPSRLILGVGDVLLIPGSGAIVQEGASVEIVGIMCESVLTAKGEVLAPQGAPNVILVRACAPGTASLEIVTGGLSRQSHASHTVVVM
ncbi:hypothetical protein [Mycolicibacterium vaccae]|uniref:hypothetical protein n=1 Tax=Mycolicibacterium vaccae TaxID=1810 RepID=UPI003D03AA08